MKNLTSFCVVLICSVSALAQQASKPPDVVAGIPVNYDESKVGNYTLPDPLMLSNGKRVSDAKTWLKYRRPEVLKLFEDIQFGKMPPRPRDLEFDVFDKGTPAFNGKAVRKQVTVYFTKDHAHKMDLLIYLPAKVKKAPLLLSISFAAPNQIVDDLAVRVGEIWGRDNKLAKADRPTPFGKINVEQFIDAGFGFATVYYGDIEPDFKDGIRYGIRSVYLKPGQTSVANNEWGAISAWAWGLSRAMDYFDTDKDIDSKRVALQGASRLGKTVLWAGAHDTRFAMVIASVSGESGAALSRRNFGETVAHMTDPTRYLYQFAPNYHSYANRVDELPVDAHMLVALIAPRPLLLQTGSTDLWSDPKGEYLAAVAAEPVYRLFGKTGPSGSTPPNPKDESLLLNDLGYYMHEGPHGVQPGDWTLFVKYMKKFL